MTSPVATTSPVTIEDDLPAAWRKTVASLETTAGFKLDSTKSPSIVQITATINPPKAEPATIDKAKKVIGLTLTCVHRLGGMLSQVGQIAFGPSEQIMNAVSFVMQVCQGTQEVFDNLTALMERLSVFLERLQMYFDRQGMMKLELNLRKGVFKVLEQFVKIMALSYKLGRSWKGQDAGWKGKVHSVKGRVQTALKVGAFGDDSGVKAAMAAFEQAVADVSDVQIDEIHRTLSEAARTIVDVSTELHATYTTTQGIASTVEQLRGGIDEEKTAKAVRSFLGLDEKDIESAAHMHSDMPAPLSGTADWLFALDEFGEWTDHRGASDIEPFIFILQGPEGYGKTNISYSVIEELQSISQRPDEQQLSMRVTWFYFRKDTSKQATVQQALKHIAWQLATKDRSYMSYLNGISGEKIGSGTLQTFSSLFKDYSRRRQPNAVLFIVLDGINHAEEESLLDLDELMVESTALDSDAEGLRVRILVTGSRESADSLRRNKDLRWHTVELMPISSVALRNFAQFNDIERFVAESLKASQVFQQMSPEQYEALQEEVMLGVLKVARGSYPLLKRYMRQIADALDIDEVREILQNLSSDGQAFVNQQIIVLNEQLEGIRIDQVNDMLGWLSVYRIPLTANALRGMMILAYRDRALLDPVSFMQKNCSRLVEFNRRNWMSFAPDAVPALEQAPAKRSTVSPAEVDMIEAMLKTTFEKTFGQYDIYKRFGFERFFEEKRNIETQLIHLLDTAEASYNMLLLCLLSRCEAEDRQYHNDFDIYSSTYWTDHLMDVNPARLITETRQNNTWRIFRLLNEFTIIKHWIDYGALLRWLHKDSPQCAAMAAWITYPGTSQMLRSYAADIDWLSSKDLIAQPRFLLHQIARYTIARWYDDQTEDLAMIWLREYFAKVESPTLIDTEVSWTIAEIDSWEEWARTLASDIDINEARWHCCMAVMIAVDDATCPVNYLELAQARCEKATQLEPQMWRAQVLRATTLMERQKFQECLELVQSSHDANTALLEVDDDYTNFFWNTIAPAIATCHLELKSYEKASEWFKRLVDKQINAHSGTPALYGQFTDLMYVLKEINAYDEAVHYVNEIMALPFLMTNDRSIEEGQLHYQLLEIAFHAPSVYEDIQKHYMSVLNFFNARVVTPGDLTLQALVHSHLRLRWYCSSTSRTEILKDWQSAFSLMADMLGRDYYKDSQYVLRTCALQLVHALVIHANGLHPADKPLDRRHELDTVAFHEAIDHLKEMRSYGLEEVSEWATMAIARLQYLNGNLLQARDELRPLMKREVNDLRLDNGQRSRGEPELLVDLLIRVDDAANAQAAWSSAVPPAHGSGDTDQKPENGHQEPGERPINLEYASGERQTELGAIDQDSVQINSEADASTATAEEHETQELPIDKTAPSPSHSYNPDADRPGLVVCNACERTPTYKEPIWKCKDCVWVDYCAECYDELMQGRLGVADCSRLHDHIKLEPFDQQRFERTWPDKVLVGDQTIPREQWLKDLGRAWGLDGWDKALAGIQRFKIMWLRRKRRRQQQEEEEATMDGLRIDTASTVEPIAV